MKNLLLLVILTFLNVIGYGQWTSTNLPTYALGAYDSIDTQEYGQVDEIKNIDQLQSIVEKYQRDSTEWYSSYEARHMAIKIYPNPSRGQIHVDGLENRDDELWILQLADMNGKLVYSAKLDPNERNINLSEVAVGNYIIRLVHGYTAYPFRITLF